MTKVKARKTSRGRVSQGDIFRDVEFIESVSEFKGVIEVSKIVFPLAVVLTQDCDLQQDASYQDAKRERPNNDDKRLLSVLVAPLYNAEHVFSGQHLTNLDMQMSQINKKKTEGRSLMQNERPRYHYLDFPDDIPIVPSIVDFKHYFSINTQYLLSRRSNAFVCSLSELYREHLSQHFASYLARIGLPDFDSHASSSVAQTQTHVAGSTVAPN